MQIDRSIVDQKMKMDRVNKLLDKIDRTKFSELQKLDILYKEVKDLSTGAGRQLQQILKGQDEQVVSVAYSMLQQVGIEPESILSRSGSTVHSSKSSSLAGSNQASPRNLVTSQNLSIGQQRPPSIASSRSSASSRSKPVSPKKTASRTTPVPSPLASSRSSRSDLSITGSATGKKF